VHKYEPPSRTYQLASVALVVRRLGRRTVYDSPPPDAYRQMVCVKLVMTWLVVCLISEGVLLVPGT
jgi:hypothetical protein